MDNQEKINKLRAIIYTSGNILSKENGICSARMAMRDLDNGDYDSAISRLNSDKDKLYGRDCWKLQDFLSGKEVTDPTANDIAFAKCRDIMEELTPDNRNYLLNRLSHIWCPDCGVYKADPLGYCNNCGVDDDTM